MVTFIYLKKYNTTTIMYVSCASHVIIFRTI